MKKLLIISLLILLSVTALSAIITGKSVFYADSYMLRARGVEAGYWNPANLIPSKYIDLWLPGVNTGVSIDNNSFDLDTYNYIMRLDYLQESDKQLILDKIDKSLHANVSGNTSIIGFTLGNMSFASSAHYMAKLALSERYLELALFGNTDSLYVFDKSNTDARALGYVDLTFGMGNLEIPFLPESFPKIRAGFSISALIGGANAYTDQFNGYLSSSMDGITLHQDMTVRSGIGGYGQKIMLGFASNPMENLELGLTLDNIFGKITWSAVTEDRNMHFTADSLYAANIGDDFYEESYETVDIENFSTELPPELRMAAMWRMKHGSVSMDYLQGFKRSVSTSSIGRLSFGAQYFPLPFLPLSFGLGLGNSTYPWRVSYGVGLNSKTGEIGLGVQSYNTLIPNYKTKGVSLGIFIRLWI